MARPGSGSAGSAGTAAATTGDDDSAARTIPRPRHPHSEAAVCLLAVARGFAVGYGVKVVVEAGRCLIAALAAALRTRPARATRGAGAHAHAASSARKHLWRAARAFVNIRSLRFGVFLGSAIGLYRAALALSRPALGRRRGDPLHPAQVVLAGSCAALAIAADSGIDAGDRRRTLTLYAAAKSLQYALQVQQGRGALPALPALPGWIFTVACAQIMFAWFYHPQTLPRSYNHWISLMANMDQGLRTALRDKHFGTVVYGVCPHTNSNLAAYITRNHLEAAVPLDQPMRFLPRVFVHPAAPHSCAHNSWNQWSGGFLRALVLYAPVHALPVLLFRLRELGGPRTKEIILRFMAATVRSSAFLATFIASIWTTICLTRHAVRDDTLVGPLLGSLVCGTSIFIEKASRRVELAMYVWPRAVDSALSRYFPDVWGRVLNGRLGLAMFCLSVGNIMYCYEFHPSTSIRPSVRSLIRRFVGRDDYNPLRSVAAAAAAAAAKVARREKTMANRREQCSGGGSSGSRGSGGGRSGGGGDDAVGQLHTSSVTARAACSGGGGGGGGGSGGGARTSDNAAVVGASGAGVGTAGNRAAPGGPPATDAGDSRQAPSAGGARPASFSLQEMTRAVGFSPY